MIAEDAAADAPDHRTVAADEGGERGFVVAVNAVIEQLAVGESHAFAQSGSAEVAEDGGG